MLVEAIGLSKHFGARGAGVAAVDNVSLAVAEGETLALIGESGCGKSTLGRLLLRLIAGDSGRVKFDGADITDLSQRELRPLRQRMQILFQHPDSSFHPRKTLIASLIEPQRLHLLAPREAAREKAVHLAVELGLHEDILDRYPHQVSGGQLQRIALARVLTLDPKFIVLDEPTSMLDVSVQAQVVSLLRVAQRRYGLTYLFITHDLDLAAAVSDRIAVMYRGRVLEQGPPAKIVDAPKHDYTKRLVSAFRYYLKKD